MTRRKIPRAWMPLALLVGIPVVLMALFPGVEGLLLDPLLDWADRRERELTAETRAKQNPDGSLPETIPEFVNHYGSLASAIHQYEQDHGWPPATLEELVPGYLPQLPEREPGGVASFRYWVYCAPIPPEMREGKPKYVWYEGASEPPSEQSPRPDVTAPEHEHLVFRLDGEDRVQGVRRHPEVPVADRIPFDRALWFEDPDSRALMFADLAGGSGFEGRSWAEIEAELGPPAGTRYLESSWAFHLWTREGSAGLVTDHAYV